MSHNFIKNVVGVETQFTIGTGFLWPGTNLVITHILNVRDQKQVKLFFDEDRWEEGKLIFVDCENSIAIFRYEKTNELSDSFFQPLPLQIGHEWIFAHFISPLRIEYHTCFMEKQQMHQNKIAFNGVEHNIINGSIIFDKDDGCGMVIDILDDQCVSTLDFSTISQYIGKLMIQDIGVTKYRCNNDKIGKKEDFNTDIYPCSCCILANHISESGTRFGIDFIIEQCIENWGYNVAMSRKGSHQWELVKPSLKITITYHEKSGFIVADIFFGRVPLEKSDALFQFLLRENQNLEFVFFSIQEREVYLSLKLIDQYIHEKILNKYMAALIFAGEHYAPILLSEYECLPNL
ncbi:MAG: hypothetical protein H6567_02505 [Lewinellaceae bacterium]|nr:hypothetical protein [Lewinellaceae bacterium]